MKGEIHGELGFSYGYICRNQKLQVSQNVSESINMGGVRLGKSRGVSNHVGEERGQLQLPSLSLFASAGLGEVFFLGGGLETLKKHYSKGF